MTKAPVMNSPLAKKKIECMAALGRRLRSRWDQLKTGSLRGYEIDDLRRSRRKRAKVRRPNARRETDEAIFALPYRKTRESVGARLGYIGSDYPLRRNVVQELMCKSVAFTSVCRRNNHAMKRTGNLHCRETEAAARLSVTQE